MKPVSASSSGKPTLNYAPPLPIRERLGRYVPSREQVSNFLKNLVWVAPLTLLIWIYAEREQTVTVSSLTFPVEVLTTAPNRLVTLRKPADKNVVVELSGPRARLDRVRELLQPKPGSPAVVRIYVDPQMNPPGQELLTVNAINNNAEFKNHGITVKSAQPPYLYVGIDTYQEIDVPVKAPPEVQRQLSDQTYFTPGVVKLRAPTELIERATAAGELAVYADVSRREEFRTKTGPQKLDNVPVYWTVNKEIQREYVTVTPVAVTANLDIRPRDVTFEIGSVPVFKETPAGLEERFRVEYVTTNPLANVKVTGPAEQIELIRNGTFKVKARVEVLSSDFTDKPNQKDLRFELPTGVTLHKDTPAKFEYRLIPKE